MRDTVDRVVGPFLEAADGALGRGYAAVLYGSAARGDFVPGRSDINLLLILDSVAPNTLRALGPALAAWRKASPQPPLLIGRAEWARAADTFPIEISDMRTASRLLRGLTALGRGIPRPHMSVLGPDGTDVGEVTSGTYSPTLRRGIALALLDRAIAEGDRVSIDVRGRSEAFEVVKPPFVQPGVREG